MQIFGVAVSIVGFSRKASVAWGARVGAHWQWQRINGLNGVLALPAEQRQAALQLGFETPQIGRLPDEQAALRELGKEVTIMLRKVVEEVFIGVEFEVLATNFHRDDLSIAQLRGESRLANTVDNA